jgi:diguanylate cyclase (GGDEF)-like protein
MRSEDVVARYGGDEFVIIVRGSSLEQLEGLATRLCEQVRSLRLVPELGVPVTVSIGVACCDSNAWYASPRALLLGADDAVYAAKEAGRNRAVCSYCSVLQKPQLVSER